MVKNILVTGGIKSGKSSYALELADKYKGEKIFLATARAFSPEVSSRKSATPNSVTITTPS